MILLWLILIPLIGGSLAWLACRWSTTATRWVALLAMGVQFLLVLGLWLQYWAQIVQPGHRQWLDNLDIPWIPLLGIHFHLSLDGLSLLLLLLTGFLGILAVTASWQGIQQRIGFFHFILLLTFTGINGVFLATDLFLFYLFWELMLIPLYFLIDIWGNERRHYAAIKFFLFTQIGGLFLLIGILGLVFAHGAATGIFTFDYFTLLHTPLAPVTAFLLMLGFFTAFAVKLPAVPVHTWLPDAHTQAPVAGSVDLAGLVLKVGAYGLLRFTVPLFPASSLTFAPVAMILGVAGIIYGAILAFGQTDLKRLVAYTSVSHMGFVLLGIYAWNEYALQGVTIILIAHGLSTSALFILVGVIDRRIHSRDMNAMGGLWSYWPRMGGFGLFFALASLGLPGFANFIGEFLVLLGTFRVAPVFAILAASGLIASVIYSVWLIQRVFWGPAPPKEEGRDLGAREIAMLLSCCLLILWIGLAPNTILSTALPSLRGLLGQTTPVTRGASIQPENIAGEHTALDMTAGGGDEIP